MGHSTARFEAIKAITNYKTTAPPLNFKELSSHECFGANVFTLAEMQKRLPKPVFKSLKRVIESGAKLERIRGRGWHSLRRKFATDLKQDTPLADLCALRGWKDHNTVLRCYMRPDEVTMRAALARRSQRRAVSG